MWRWRHDERRKILTYSGDGEALEWYSPSTLPGHTHRPNRWSLHETEVPTTQEAPSDICSVREISPGIWCVRGTTSRAPRALPATSWLDVLDDWGDTWIWDNLTVEEDEDWVIESINAGDCMAVTDGSYMEDIDSSICSAAFIFECKRGRGRIHGSFWEQSDVACSYRGELLGLLAIHLILLSIKQAHGIQEGMVDIFSDCLTALWTVEHLPPTMIPSRFQHADILKIILINCGDLGFQKKYTHVPAHQDDHEDFDNLSRPSQLNCIMDQRAKACITERDVLARPHFQQPLPLEAVTVHVGKNKVTSNSGARVRFWAHKDLARAFFSERKILFPQEFDLADWEMVHSALNFVPRLFQIWICKQVMGIAGTFQFRSRYEENTGPMCPSCTVEEETCAHVLRCREQGRVAALMGSIDLLDDWLEENDTDPVLHEGILRYARGRGEFCMVDAFAGQSNEYRRFGLAQDQIGWRRFMEGMVVKECRALQQQYRVEQGLRDNSRKWMRILIIKLMECTHGQWLYRNVVVHDATQGMERRVHKEQIRDEIRQQLELGGEGLSDEDQYLLEINLNNMEGTAGKKEEYWLLAIRAARVAKQLRDGAALQRQEQGIG